MRTPKVHESKSIRFTDHAKYWCETLNQHRKLHPTDSFQKIAKFYGLSETSARRYYYGLHHFNGGFFGPYYSQIRQGASVSI